MHSYQPITLLHKNDHIRILCTARIGSAKKLAPAIGWLRSLGYRVSLGKTVGKSHHQYGGTDQERLEDFQDALVDPDIHAIWIARGGYGSIKIVDEIDMSVLNGENKLLMGYSDVTNLHGLWQRNGLQSLHCFMPQEFPEKPEEILSSWTKTVTGVQQSFKLPNENKISNQTITAPLVGGNLSVLLSMLGSSTFPELDNHILFIEDLDEYLYHIDRLMTCLRRAGKLAHLKGLVVGGMTDMRDHEIPFGKTAHEIVLEHTKEYNYPVLFDFPAGHVVDNYSLVLGKSTTIKIENDSILITQ